MRTAAQLLTLLIYFWTGSRLLAQSPLDRFQSELKTIVSAASPAFVAVATLIELPASPLPPGADPFELVLLPNPQGALPARFGGGVVIDVQREPPALLVLTSYELIEPALIDSQTHASAARIAIRTAMRQTLSAQIESADPISGLAVLRAALADAVGSLPQPLILGEAEKLQPGALLASIGDPATLAREGSGSAALGIVSNWTVQAPSPVPFTLSQRLLADIRLDPAMSGCVILDLQGRLVALSGALSSAQHAPPELISTLPCTSGVRRVIEDLRQGYEADYGLLAAQTRTVTLSPTTTPEALQGRSSVCEVTQRSAGGPAARAGLQVGDRILAVQGQDIVTNEQLIQAIALLGPDAEADLTIFRPGASATQSLHLRTGKFPRDDRPWRAVKLRQPPWRGLDVDFATARQALLPRSYPAEHPSGVLVTSVAPGSPAASAGLKRGDFITKVGERPIDTPAQFHAALGDWPGTVPLTLQDGREAMIAEPK